MCGGRRPVGRRPLSILGRVTDSEPKRRFLVAHDYGMGALWWWILARSEREIRETFAETEVIEDPETIADMGSDLAVVDIDATVMPPGLDGLREDRDAQRGRPGFGALADRDVLHLRWRDGDDPAVYLVEVGNDGRRTRQVELTDDGGVRGDPGDWFFNTPIVDVFDPDLVGMEIGREEFEHHWARAHRDERQ